MQNGWHRAPLKLVAPAKTASVQFKPEEPVWQLTLDQIEADTGNIVGKKIAPAKEAGSSTHCFDTGNVLYSKLRPYLNKVIRPHEKGIATTELVPLRPKPGVLDADFLTYYLRSAPFVQFASQFVAGAKMPRVMMKKFWAHEMPLPSPSEQRRIVEILEQADALRKKRAEADRIADRILPALFYKMFGDPATNPKGWNVEPLGTLGELDRGRSRHRPRNDPRLLGGPYPFIQTGDVAGAHGYIRTHTATYSEFGLSQSKMWPTGTLCITIAANIAASAILGFDACFPDSVVGFTSGPRTNAAFVRVLLGFLRPILESSAPQMAQKNINLKILRDINVPVPPKELQDRFAGEHDCVVSMAENARKSADWLETLFTVLLHRAFSGDLTARWREAHIKELRQEMEQQARCLAAEKTS